MKGDGVFRQIAIALVLCLGVLWSLNSAAQKETRGYPNSRFMADANWLKQHMNDPGLVIVDVRSDDYFDGSLIPGAVRLPWSEFRFNDLAANLASTFVGVSRAQEILGRHGITRTDTVVLYDSVERDGGATASYLFWVLDVLGHDKMMILQRGIDGWTDAGFDLVTRPREVRPLLYQAKRAELRMDRLIDGAFVYARLGDPFYRIVDVRSPAEYTGEKGTKGMDGTPLKLGHIPTAVNINYVLAWTDPETKAIKPYAALQQLYKGLDSDKGLIVYCNSGRRSAFSYYVLRLMGFESVCTYEPSWKEWGNPEKFYPVETRENKLVVSALPEPSRSGGQAVRQGDARQTTGSGASGAPSGGYVLCGG